MSSVEDKVQRLENSVGDIKIELVGVHHAISDQANILKELKEVIVNQNKTLNSVYELKGKVEGVESELKELQEDYRIRKDSTDVFIREGASFMDKAKGGLAVAVFCFTMIQAVVGYNLVQASDTISKTSTELRKVEMELHASKARQDYLKETLDKILVDHKNGK
jgi:polysaccharide pyruvyl transferase WcaK-like protein